MAKKATTKKRSNRGPTSPHKKHSKGPWEPTPKQLEVYADCHRGDLTEEDVGKRHGISRQRVNQLKHKITDWLIPRNLDRIKALKTEHTQRLMHVYREAMRAWERSKDDAQERRQGISGEHDVDITTTKAQTGNPSYLAEARAALEQIRKIWGADAPLKIEHEHGEEQRVAGKPLHEVRAEYMQRLLDSGSQQN